MCTAPSSNILIFHCRYHAIPSFSWDTKVTILLGASLQHFKDVNASGFETRELGKEYNARLCRKARKAANTTSGTTPSFPIIPTDSTIAAVTSTSMLLASEANRPTEAVDPMSMPAKVSKKRVPFNMNTYKAHSFPDYVRTIRRFGTTDSYSTELVSWTFYSVSDIFHIWFLS